MNIYLKISFTIQELGYFVLSEGKRSTFKTNYEKLNFRRTPTAFSFVKRIHRSFKNQYVVDFPPFLTRQTTFVDRQVCFPALQVYSENGSTLKGNNLHHFFPF